MFLHLFLLWKATREERIKDGRRRAKKLIASIYADHDLNLARDKTRDKERVN